MTLADLAWKDLSRNPFRSWTVLCCAALVAGLVLVTALITHGAGDSLRLTQGRLGADILVVPRGSEPRVESALLMGSPSKTWMPVDTVRRIRSVPGVSAASPQMYLASLSNASCCSASNMFVVAFDPASDFTVQPWLRQEVGGELRLGEVVGGSFVVVPDGETKLRLYSYPLTLRSTLEPTGGNLDRSIFLTFETAKAIASASVTGAVKPLQIPPDSVSSVLVRVEDGTDPGAVAAAIAHDVPGVGVVQSPRLFESFRGQIGTLQAGLIAVLGVTVGLSLMLIAVVFSMAAHERRREIGVLRALGATHVQIVASLVMQAAALAAAGGVAGAAFAAYATYLFHDYIVARTGFPFLFPAPASLLALVSGGLAAAICAAVLASLVPAVRSSLQDPAVAMRE